MLDILHLSEAAFICGAGARHGRCRFLENGIAHQAGLEIDEIQYGQRNNMTFIAFHIDGRHIFYKTS
jgi:hypothetical protein